MKKLLLLITLLSNICFSQQVIQFCNDDTLKMVTYSTDAGKNGTYYWSVDGTPYMSNESSVQVTWTSQDKGQHTLMVYFDDEISCSSDPVTLTIVVDVCEESEMFAPNCFTPNGDMSNNTWMVKGQNYFDGYVYIVNRWGEMVFESYNLEIGWDGTYNGSLCPDGVYIFILIWKDSKGFLHQQTGQISLFR